LFNEDSPNLKYTDKEKRGRGTKEFMHRRKPGGHNNYLPTEHTTGTIIFILSKPNSHDKRTK